MPEDINIVIGGDLFPTQINYELFRQENMAENIFGKQICALFKQSDYAICNLEGCFTAEETKPKLKDGPNIRAPKECVSAIYDLGVNCVSLANNHTTDYGIKGLTDTCKTLDQVGISYFGAGNDINSIIPYKCVCIKGKKFIFYGVSETIENNPTVNSPGVNIYDEYRICNELRKLKKQCDYLIVLYHGGIENLHYNTPSIRIRFHRMADSGANIVISQHTHAIGEEEYYRDSYLLYGQGNFCFHFSKRLDEWVRTALLLSIDFEEQGFNVKKYLVRRDGPRVIFDPEQDLNEFYERSRRLDSGENFEKELEKLADEKLIIYLNAFRGKNLKDKIARRILSRENYIRYLRNQYTQKQILKILLALQCEEFREVSSTGIQNMLRETLKR